MNITVFAQDATVRTVTLGTDISNKNIEVYIKINRFWKRLNYFTQKRTTGIIDISFPKLATGNYEFKIIYKPYTEEISILTGTVIAGVDPNPTPVAHVQSDWTEANAGSQAYIKHKPVIVDPVQSDWNEADNTDQAFILNKPVIPAGQIQSDWAQASNVALDYIKNKPSIPAAQIQSDWTQVDNLQLDFIKNKPTLPTLFDIEFEYADIATRTAAYILDLKASFPYTILSGVFVTDAGTCTVAIKINGTNVTSLSAVGVTNSITETNATGANSVTAGQLVTLTVSSVVTATRLAGKLKIQR